MKFRKKDFKERYKNKGKNEIDEFFTLGDDNSDRPNISSNSEITTNTVKCKLDDFSNYKDGQPIDTDKAKVLGMNTFIRLQGYGYNMGNPFGVGGMYNESYTNEDKAKERMVNLVKELLQKKNDSGEFVSKQDIDLDINNNNITDIDELNNPDISVATNDLIDAIVTSELDDKSLEIIFNHIKKNIK